MKPKSPLLSKTLWVNGLVALAALIDQIAPFLPANVAPKALAVLAGVNIVLRFLTNQPITSKEPE